jgi:hypothetical protein
MEHTSRRDLEDLMTKNNFTTEAPLVFAMYLDKEYGRGPVLIESFKKENGELDTRHREVALSDILNTDPSNAFFAFEDSFNGYDRYAIKRANRSDVVVIDRSTDQHASAFEVKLCVVPNSGSAKKEHDRQSCEIVVRPPSVEQLAFSIADTYGESGRMDLQQTIVRCLGGNTQGFRWSDKGFMLSHMSQIRDAAQEIAMARLEEQKPFAITGIWRTQGQSGLLEESCFDTFVWTNLSFLQLLSSRKTSKAGTITRPERSLIWLIKALYDYSIQGKVDFNKAHSDITFDAQTDKAGAFAGKITYQFLAGPRLYQPLIPRHDLPKLIPNEAISLLMPERRLDAALFYADAIEKARSGEDSEGSEIVP